MTPISHMETLAIHAGQSPDPATGAVIPPVYMTSTYAQEHVGVTKGFDYSRTANPTRLALEQCLAALEGLELKQPAYGLAFSSGMAAIDTLLRLIKPGEHVLASNDVYGGTYRLFEHVLKDYGIKFSYIDVSNPNLLENSLLPETRLVWLETPTNPLLKIADILEISRRVKSRSPQILVAVDNTFASPHLQQPLALGADFVVHSTTKYLGGHSDVIGGAIVMKDRASYERLRYLQNAVGAVPGPMDCWLILRGIKTLSLRMERHSTNAVKVSEYLCGHSAVEQVIYPGLDIHPGHEVAKKQMKMFGGMVSVILKGGENAARKMVEATRIFALAESLGGVESLIEVPAAMTHASVAGSPLEVPAGLVRLSVGIENIDDLIADLDNALSGL
ncbi:MAG: cystathionine gamma-synthase [Chloroflexi bacterium]|nr:MAG: cystathionine gamma-synthase [Chloroflexota bacterium]MBA4376120.1 cystathionine gamma-synthase [Anaerolinea sp.]